MKLVDTQYNGIAFPIPFSAPPVALCLGTYSDPRGVGVSYERGTPGIPTLGTLSPRGGPGQDPVLTGASQGLGKRLGGKATALVAVADNFFFTLVTGPRRALSLKLSDTRVYEPEIRTRLGRN